MLSDLLTFLLLKPCIGLRLDHLFEESWVNSSDDIDEVLTRRPLSCGKLVVHVSFDLFIVFHLLDQVLHAELIVVRQSYSVDPTALETLLVSSKKLADELTIHLVVLVQVVLASKDA